ncbi:prephenate dehydrogenase/arogenate dehydrogenase family protein [Leptospira sp. 2 VSF19]|uniref:Prephenate dehydrogenase/arogenate dehydrogenase family protein n=1 Tax=Leptospira soteropolitanensis TaxID=2950025 RepID=A0AAW5VQU5_9LEPT|nr:prephenate dehydrogenase/arogenate dehydrogenase family protein [Leptospira soteropolitanensis]MCW7493689.1 prephenate dehydrogenase/arogenate dehydrogenase family protein [Leptospira soteropolitanensis]MCW7501287.1 prephenate dehydrogenase/arogenate dehydrogenase family protein [Leptospira soteropolitanensis]MCW7523527.1 prephenate dehydrogenase/arogenate dehydrogenase family protein [Leptospira soteropolitanensis]MCW7527401.1 prephenate dehydrogenase/arogenate dehydrogenase family protein 
MNLSKVLIYGMGLMGGSLALSIRRKFPEAEITAVVRSEKSKSTILNKQLANFVFLQKEFLTPNWSNYDLVVFSTPVESILKIIPILPKSGNTIFIDLGSTKETTVTAVESYYGKETHHYISTHPMCGSEQAGPDAAIENLYVDKLCILTKPNSASDSSFEWVRNFWEKIGSWTIEMDSKSHDETLAYLSHLPHVVSTILVNVAGANFRTMKEVTAISKPITGGGFRDMSRIAGSNPEMWISIFKENKEFLSEAIDDFILQLTEFRNLLKSDQPFDENKMRSLWELALSNKEEIRKSK